MAKLYRKHTERKAPIVVREEDDLSPAEARASCSGWALCPQCLDEALGFDAETADYLDGTPSPKLVEAFRKFKVKYGY